MKDETKKSFTQRLADWLAQLVNAVIWGAIIAWFLYRPGGPVDDAKQYFDQRFDAIAKLLAHVDAEIYDTSEHTEWFRVAREAFLSSPDAAHYDAMQKILLWEKGVKEHYGALPADIYPPQVPTKAATGGNQ